MSILTLKDEISNHDTMPIIRGHLTSYRVNVQVKMLPIFDRKGADAPHWEVIAKAPHGGEVVIGVAWENDITRGDNAGKKLLSIALTDPEFEGVSFSAFPLDGKDDQWKVEVSRPRKQKEQPAATPAPLVDEIPF